MQTFRRLSDHFDLVPAAINRQLSGIDIARGRQEAVTVNSEASGRESRRDLLRWRGI
jgi:hypothetical protein